MFNSALPTTLPPLSLHLGNLPGFEFSSDRETPISSFSGVFPLSSSSSHLSSSISPLSLNFNTPITLQGSQKREPTLRRASTFPLANPSVPRLQPPHTPHTPVLPEGFQKCSFVDCLVDTGALLIETIWPNQLLPLVNPKILPLRVFIQETIRRSRTSFSTLQLALYYLLRIKGVVRDFATKNPEWFNGPSNFGKTAEKHPIACGRRMFLAAVIIASKYLQDRNFSNRAWAKISGLSVKEINANEFVFLNVAKYDLYVGEALYKRWSGVLLTHVMASVSVSTVSTMQSPGGLVTPPGTPRLSPLQSPSGHPAHPNPLRAALAHRFCNAIRGLSPSLTESELSSLPVIGQQSPQPKPMSPPPSRNGPIQNGSSQQSQYNTSPIFPLNPLLQSCHRLPPYEGALTPPLSASSDSGSDSDVWSPRSTVSSASSNDLTNTSPDSKISPRANLGRNYLKQLRETNLSPQSSAPTTGTSSSVLYASNCARLSKPVKSSPLASTPRPTTPNPPGDFSSDEQMVDWSSTSAATIDPKLLHLNSSALTAVRGLCSLSQRAMVFSGSKRTNYPLGNVQPAYETTKRKCGAISDETLARIL